MERELTLEFVRVTEAAALASARWMGRGDKMAADDAAVRAMRAVFDTISMDGTVVIGEGELDEAPMLYIGEKVGNRSQPRLDVAVDPLEGTNLVAKGGNGAIAVLAVAEEGCLLHAPDMYMNKIAVGPWAKGKIDLDASVSENLKAVAASLKKSVHDLTVVILDRERHEKIVKEARDCGCFSCGGCGSGRLGGRHYDGHRGSAGRSFGCCRIKVPRRRNARSVDSF